MTTKHIKDVLTAVRDGSQLSDDAQEAATRALAELSAVHHAAKVLDSFEFGASYSDSEVRKAFELMASIVRDAP